MTYVRYVYKRFESLYNEIQQQIYRARGTSTEIPHQKSNGGNTATFLEVDFIPSSVSTFYGKDWAHMCYIFIWQCRQDGRYCLGGLGEYQATFSLEARIVRMVMGIRHMLCCFRNSRSKKNISSKLNWRRSWNCTEEILWHARSWKREFDNIIRSDSTKINILYN